MISTDADSILRLLMQAHGQTVKTSLPWWVREAVSALAASRFQVILSRDRSALYLLRFWLTDPQLGNDGGFESGDSLLLHHFCAPDDDDALHDHPWDFITTILAGGYAEHRPPVAWLNALNVERALSGPAWDQQISMYAAGSTIEREAEDLHCIGRIAPSTWTLVRTGRRRRAWGFHPPGKPWTPFREYLDTGKPATA